MDQKEVLIYTSHQSWHCRRTRRLLRQRGCDFDVIDTSDDAELHAWLAHFTEEGNRR
jgi:arsenate reductase-like glutaredoxin family protein